MVEEPEAPAIEPRAPSAPTIEHAACDQQWAFVTSLARLIALLCSRRAGKTEAAILMAALVLSRPGTWVHYISLRRRNAKTQFFWKLLDYLERPASRKGLGWVRDVDFWVNEADMLITTAWGSNLKAASCPTMADVGAVKGDRTDLFIVDECQDPNDDVVTALIDTAATPMTTDTGGAIVLMGTPPEVEPCFFSAALDSEGWERHSWTQFEHDLPRPREAKWETAKEGFRRRGMRFHVQEDTDADGKLVLTVDPTPENTHPLVLREFFGLRARDPSKVAYEFDPARNTYDPAAVDFSQGRWQTVWGLDLAGGQSADSDCDAIVVGQQRAGDPERRIYVRWQWQCRHLDTFDLADLARVVKLVLPAGLVVGDDGGHAAIKTLMAIGRVLGLTIEAKPRDVLVSLRATNDELRSARLLVPTRDVITPVLLAKAREVYPAPADAERADGGPGDVRVEADGGRAVVANLADELPRVFKSVNPKTKKVQINRRQGHGIHSDISETLRYMVSGFTRGPIAPGKAIVTDPQQAARDWVTKDIESRMRANRGRFSGYR